MTRPSRGRSRPWRGRRGRGDGYRASSPPPAPIRIDTASMNQSPLIGECLQLCPPTEESERTRDHEISRFERPTEGLPELVAVKKYRRAAAGRDNYNQEDLRPASVLLQTLRHLFLAVLKWPNAGFYGALKDANATEFLAVYHFVNDRIRSVRQDFTVQRIEGQELITALQQAVRFYLVAGLRSVQLLEAVKSQQDWSDKLNDEQLASALSQLQALYNTQERSRLQDPGEFIAYDLLLHADDPQSVGWMLRKLTSELRGLPSVQRAIRTFVLLQMDDFYGFVRQIAAMSLLEQAVTLRHLPRVWKTSMKMMNKAYGKQDRFALEELARWMNLADIHSEFEGGEQAERLCKALNIQTQRHPLPEVSAEPKSTVHSEEDAADIWETIDIVNGLAEVVPIRLTKPSSLGFAQFKLAPLHNDLDSEDVRTLLCAISHRLEDEDALPTTELIVKGPKVTN